VRFDTPNVGKKDGSRFSSDDVAVEVGDGVELGNTVVSVPDVAEGLEFIGRSM
jgi:hypothetical protein